MFYLYYHYTQICVFKALKSNYYNIYSVQLFFKVFSKAFNLEHEEENASAFSFFRIRRQQKEKNEIFEKVIKSEEFLYHDNISFVIKKWLKDRKSDVWINFEDILHEMKAPEVHYHLDCPQKCIQKQKCKRIRQTKQLVRDLLKEMSKKFPVFEEPEVIIVGSMKEKTKVGEIDEADLLLLMNEKYKGYFKFNEKKQRIEKIMEVPEALKPFLNGKIFDTTKYFQTFVEEIHRVISSGFDRLPKGLTLSTNFTPCDVCKNHDDNQNIRCRHKKDCEEHLKRLSNPQYEENCNCKEFSSPCLTFSKIGVVLHLQFQEPDGSVFNLDADVNPPTIPVTNIDKFNGSNEMKRKWILENRHKIVNWRSEYWKSYDMSAAVRYNEDGEMIGGGTRSVRLRLVNRNMVIPEQVASNSRFFLYYLK